MAHFKFEKIESMPSELEEVIQQGHVQDEANKGIICNYKKFYIVIKGNQDEIVGALSSYTAFAEIYVDDIWVKPDYRGQGLGRKLLLELESRFAGKGYNNINLVTSAFQAPEFYRSCGFEQEFKRENKINPKLTKFFFIKYFKDEEQTQGTL